MRSDRTPNSIYEKFRTQRIAADLVPPGTVVHAGEKDLCIDLGCGKFPHGIDEYGNEYLHFDQHPDAKADVFCDLNCGIPLEDDSVAQVYCSHFLEHVEDPEYFVAEIYRVCQPGARVRFVVPAWQNAQSFEVNHLHQITESFFAINWVFTALFEVTELRWEDDEAALAAARRAFGNPPTDEDLGRFMCGVHKQLWVTCTTKKPAGPDLSEGLFEGGNP